MNRGANTAPPLVLDPFDGVLLVDKPSGPTSHDVVDAIRRHFRFGKVGHGGTLDPQATGLLIVLLGRGTRLSNAFTGSDKTYEGTLRLGIATTTHDADGRVESERDCSAITREQVEAQMERMRGDQLQTPPMVSAVKVDGVPLYKAARKGKVIDREPRLIHVYEFRMLRFEHPRAAFRIRCTKGTYVRTLCATIGENLGCGAHLEALRRTACGELTVDAALTLDEALKLDRRQLLERVIPMNRFGARRPG